MTYTVAVTRKDSSWPADVPSVVGAHTFAKSLDGLINSIREVIVLMDDLPDDAEPQIQLDYRLGDADITDATQLAVDRRRLAARGEEVQQRTQQLAIKLTARGYSVRDTARILGITPGRDSQLIKTKTNRMVQTGT